jgi:cytochrome c-type biogenesis protein CcmF
VRSGVLTSVHAFAADPTRGLFVLVFLAIVIGGSLVLYALRAPGTDGGAEGSEGDPRRAFAPASRETLLLVNNLLLACACAMVLLGTLYPLLADALELGKISVGPPYFAFLFTLLMAPLVLLLPFGPLTRWQREQPSRPFALLVPWLGLALGAGIAAFFLAPQGQWKVAAGVAGALWVGFGTLRFAWQRLRAPGGRMTPEMLGMTFAHLGIAVFLVGALLVEGLSRQHELALAPGQQVELGGYAFRFDGVERHPGPNYIADTGTVTVFRGGRELETLHPEKRSYASGGQVMTEAAIDAGVVRDLYVALGEPLGNGSWAVRVHVKPFVRWIWFGAVLMAIGGLVTATDRRFRRRDEAAR